MAFKWHLLSWGIVGYFFLNEGLSLGDLSWLFLAVVSPWLWLVRSGHLFSGDERAWLSINPLLWTRFLMLFLKEFVLANLKLLKLIWFHRGPIKAAWVEIPTKLDSPFSHMLIANFLTLTPGTITWNIQKEKNDQRGAVLSVHVLNEKEVEGIMPLVKLLEKIIYELTTPKPKGVSP